MKPLVAYFSATGTTARAARALAQAVEGELYEIKPALPYTAADLDWRDKTSRSSREMADPGCRPALADADAPVAGRQVIYLGFPVWWYRAPAILHTFLETYDFAGKTILLFATSGGSGLGQSAEKLQPSAPKARILEGPLLNGPLDQGELKRWAGGLKL